MVVLARLLNAMVEAGVITDYALFEAVAQMRYTEPVATLDADVLIALPSPQRLNPLTDSYRFCSERGYAAQGEAVRVGDWPVQFIPAFNELTREAMAAADVADFEGVPLRVVPAAHLAVIALGVGRAKDWARILALLESGSVSPEEIGRLAARHGLAEEWQRFQKRFIDD